jgi:tRNA A-37 threonylcarbamoyl transferase component Bud32
VSETKGAWGHITFGVSPQALQQFLADLPRVGKLVKDRAYRQIWRFDFEGKGYYLKFYPRKEWDWKRVLRGSAARREFDRLVLLQKAGVSAPRAVAQLVGFKIGDRKGDALILEAIEPAVQLDEYLHGMLRQGRETPNRLELAGQIRKQLALLARAGLGHNDLHLGNFLLSDGEVFLLDGYAVSSGGLLPEHVMNLAHSAQSFLTRTELVRGWNELGPGGPPPLFNPVSGPRWEKLLRRTRGENLYFGKIRSGAWRGIFFKFYKFPRRWAASSDLRPTREEWEGAWPKLWEDLEAGRLTALKRGPSGDVWAAEVTLNGRVIPIVIKRPYKRYWYRYLNEIGRGSRSWRAWRKAWAMVVRDVPTAWPLAVMQKYSHGYITDSALVLERVEGQTLEGADLDAIAPRQRDALFRRIGRLLRKIDQTGMSHYDAKSSNWIVRKDEVLGERPVLIDVDGLRFRRWPAFGLHRLLRSMRAHAQYTPADSLSLCRGYSPFSRVEADDS